MKAIFGLILKRCTWIAASAAISAISSALGFGRTCVSAMK